MNKLSVYAIHEMGNMAPWLLLAVNFREVLDVIGQKNADDANRIWKIECLGNVINITTNAFTVLTSPVTSNERC